MTVAPFTGAWIEIVYPVLRLRQRHVSHPSRVRGLKYQPAVGEYEPI